jgi:Ca2+-binding RTX toxin-like protein
MDTKLFNAILSMDSYNRGYDQGIPLNTNPDGDSIGLQIGNAVIVSESDIESGSAGRNASFYAVAYQMPNDATWNGQTIISYRGTDSAVDGAAYPIATGFTGVEQASMAFQFYNAVATAQNGNISIDPRDANISLTGHSLGGGLAGLVGGVYHQDAVLFDNMPFEVSAQNTQFSPIPDYISAVYQGISPWTALVGPTSGMHTYSLDGEFLSWTRPAQQTLQTEYSLPGSPNLTAYLPDSADLHSMASLIIHMFSITEIGGAADWESASPYFWPILYQDDFAQSIGEQSAGLLRTKLAYSAIDEGVTVFGNTGIRAFYDDANDLGAALVLTGDVWTSLAAQADNISKVFVQFAGSLAIHKVEVSLDYQSAILRGVLEMDRDDRTFAIDLSDSLWAEAGGGLAPVIAARDSLVGSLLAGTGAEAEVRAAMHDVWGDGSNNAIEKVEFAVYSAQDSLYGPVTSYMWGGTNDPTKAALFIGGDRDDVIRDTGGNNLISGGSGSDVLDYGLNGSGVTIVWAADGTLKVVDGHGNMDVVTGVEKIVGSGGAVNTLEIHGAGDVKEVAPGEYELNGHRLGIENLSAIKGDAADQVFTLQGVPAGGVDGGAGEDTVSYSMDGGIYNQNTGKFYSNAGATPLVLQNIEHENRLGTPSTLVIDTSVAGLAATGACNDYSSAAIGGTFDFYASNWIYNSYSLYFSIDRTFSVSVDIGGIHQSGPGFGQSATVFGTHGLQSVLGDYTVVRGHANFRGTDNGDTASIVSNPWLTTSVHFASGYGNDTISVSGSVSPFGGASVTYTKGNDVLQAGGGLTSLIMWADIRPSDVSLSGNLITVAGHGTITVNGTSASSLNIVYAGTEYSATIEGSWGIDNWTGKDGRDETFYAFGGNDTLNGAGGQDRLFGGDGDDVLYSLNGTGFLDGGDGNDVFHVGKNALTTVSDTAGANVLYLDDFNRADVALAQANDGSLVFEDSSRNAILTVKAGAVFSNVVFQNGETISFAALHGEMVLSGRRAFYNTGDEGDYVGQSTGYSGAIAIVDLKGGNDSYQTAAIGAVPDIVYGGAGRDFILTGGGNDRIYGGEGDDYTLSGGAGDDLIDGGDGVDTAYYNEVSPVSGAHVDLGAGIAYHDGKGGVDTLVSIENVTGTKLDDILIGTEDQNVIFGSGGNDTLKGLGGDDFFTTYGGNSVVDGGEGSDFIMYGGVSGVVANLQTGVVLNNGYGGQDTLISIENVWIDSFDVINVADITGSDADNVIRLWGGGTARGGDGNDTLEGGYYGFVTLMGGAGDDKLVGSRNDDVLIGGAGDDILQGGEGNDTYIFAPGDGLDTILDNEGTNILQIEGGIPLAGLVTTQVGNDLVIHIASGVTIKDYFSAAPEERSFYAAFSDGTVLSMENLPVTNHAPVAMQDDFFVNSGGSLSGNLLADNGYGVDGDSDGNSISAIAKTLKTASGASFALLSDGSFSYAPEVGFSGFDTVTYLISDSFGAVSEGTANFVVLASNSPPEAKDDYVETDEDNILAVNVLGDNGNGMDGDRDGNSITVVSAALTTSTGASVLISGNGDVLYTPEANFYGTDSFTYVLKDEDGMEDIGTVFVTVTPVNDNPIAKDDKFDVSGGRVSGNLLLDNGVGADGDIDGDHLAVVPTAGYVSTSKGGLVTISANGDFSYSSVAGFFGKDSFQYTLDDGRGGYDTAVVYLNVKAESGRIIGDGSGNILWGDDVGNFIYGQGGGDIIFGAGGGDHLYGGAGSDIIYAGSGYDIVTGGSGQDIIYGDGGNDILVGGYVVIMKNSAGEMSFFATSGSDGGDIISGGAGNDALVGCKGKDILSGGSGKDVFVFLKGALDAADVIEDFSLREGDAIDISQILEQQDPVSDAISDFVRITQKNGNSIVSVDANGGGDSFVQVAVLEGVRGLEMNSMIENGSLIV